MLILRVLVAWMRRVLWCLRLLFVRLRLCLRLILILIISVVLRWFRLVWCVPGLTWVTLVVLIVRVMRLRLFVIMVV